MNELVYSDILWRIEKKICLDLKGKSKCKKEALLFSGYSMLFRHGSGSRLVRGCMERQSVILRAGSHLAHLLSGHMVACLLFGSYFHLCFICKFLKGLGVSSSSRLHYSWRSICILTQASLFAGASSNHMPAPDTADGTGATHD